MRFVTVWLLWMMHGLVQPVAGQPANQLERLRLAKAEAARAERSGNAARIAKATYALGKAYVGVGDHLNGQRCFHRLLRRQEAAGPSHDLVRTYVQLANSHVFLKQFPEAHRYAHRALAVAGRVPTSDSLHARLSACHILAAVHQEGETAHAGATFRLDSAFYYLYRAERLARRVEVPIVQVGIQWVLATLWSSRDGHRAIGHAHRALAGYRALKHPHNTVESALLLERLYRQTGQWQQAGGWLAFAQATYQQANLDAPLLLEKMEVDHSALSEHRAQYKQALLHTQKAHELETRRMAADRTGAIARLNVQYETAKRDLLLRNQRSELLLRNDTLALQQKVLWLTLSLLGLTLGMSAVFWHLYRVNRRISRRNAELVREQSHRVENNLQAVSNLLTLQTHRLDKNAQSVFEETQLRLQAMAHLHRRMYQSQPAAEADVAAVLPDVVQHVLRAYGFADVPAMYQLTPLPLSPERSSAVLLIVNELVTNACKYAFPHAAAPQLQLTLTQSNRRAHLTVADNGPGLPPQVLQTEPTSFGLQLIRWQVQQVQGEYAFRNINGTTFAMTF